LAWQLFLFFIRQYRILLFTFWLQKPMVAGLPPDKNELMFLRFMAGEIITVEKRPYRE